MFIEVANGLFTNIGYIPGDLLGAKFGITCFHFMLLNVNRCIAIFLNQFLGNQDRILKVAAFPGDKSNQDVLSKS